MEVLFYRNHQLAVAPTFMDQSKPKMSRTWTASANIKHKIDVIITLNFVLSKSVKVFLEKRNLVRVYAIKIPCQTISKSMNF